jgi:uncharacterized protein with GYD domain
MDAWIEGGAMPTYVTLIRYTQQGVETFKDLPRRLEETRKAGEAAGAKLVAFYLTMGQYDAVVISEAPDDQTAARLSLAAGGRGNVRTETLRAFDENEAKSIAAGL